jgi:SAM-dependent methyltransferase
VRRASRRDSPWGADGSIAPCTGSLRQLARDADRSLVVEQTPAGFGRFAASYDEQRPAYPSEALDWLLPTGSDHVVADVGAGTGKLTRSLISRCRVVLAVEPDDAMIRQLKLRQPSALAVRGVAEALPFRRGSLDTILVAQAWHWFDSTQALKEFARVAGPGAHLALLWNAPAPEDEWQRRLYEGKPVISPVNEDWWPAGLPREHTERRLVYWADWLTPDDICREHSTHLAVQKLPPADRHAYLAETFRLAWSEAEGRSSGRVPYRRMTWCARHLLQS